MRMLAIALQLQDLESATSISLVETVTDLKEDDLLSVSRQEKKRHLQRVDVLDARHDA